MDVFGGFKDAHADFEAFLSGLDLTATTHLALDNVLYEESNQVVLTEGADFTRPATPEERIDWECRRQKRLAVQSAFMAEISKHVFYYLGKKQINGLDIDPSKLYLNPLDGWATVLNKWPDLTDDVRQSSRCLAIDEPTAAVFHIVRCAEYVLRQICVQESIPHISKFNMMGNYLQDIDEYIKHPNTPPKRAELNRIMSLMRNLKDGWRDDTMHTGVMYQDFEAIAAYSAVKSALEICVIL
jgi:hypothetical protein